MAKSVDVDQLRSWDVPADFQLPTAREIELELALGSESWTSLLSRNGPQSVPAAGAHAIVIGGSMAGLLAARVLADHFNRVTIIDRDNLPGKAKFRDGVPQSRHLHALLRRGLNVMEGLFPGLEAELIAAGAVRVTGTDFLRMSAAGWAKRFDGPGLITATRELMESCVRSRTLRHPKVTVLPEQDVIGLLAAANRTSVAGVRMRARGSRRADGPVSTLHGDLVIDATGRTSKAPDWLQALGYAGPEETLINSFLGYASCMFAPGPGFHADWRVLMIGDKPPLIPRAGLLFPIEGNRWMVTLAGYGRDYPPTDEAGFFEFARSLRSDILYESIKDAEQISRISGFRSTVNQRRHFETLNRRPERFVVIGDAACAFNPVYGQGMSVAAMTAIALQEGLQEHSARHGLINLSGLAGRLQHRVAKASEGAWVIATGADVRYPTTEGRRPHAMDRVMHRYLDRVIEVANRDAVVNAAFLRVVHLMDSPRALFRPAVALRALAGAGQPLDRPPTSLTQAMQRSANTRPVLMATGEKV